MPKPVPDSDGAAKTLETSPFQNMSIAAKKKTLSK
jgi:hypothetical protein